MLNISALRKQFDEILNSFTKQDLQNWLEFANQREISERLQIEIAAQQEISEKLQKGEIVNIVTKPLEMLYVTNMSVNGMPEKGYTYSNNYVNAA